MRILIYTTHRTGSTSLANFLMFNYLYDYQRYAYFKKMQNDLPTDIIIKLTPNEIDYNIVKNLFDKRIILIREDIKAQAESRVYSEIFGKKFSSYTIENTFFEKYSNEITKMCKLIECENKLLVNCKDALQLTYSELYKSNIGIVKLENYFDTKFKYELEYKRYRNMNQNLL